MNWMRAHPVEVYEESNKWLRMSVYDVQSNELKNRRKLRMMLRLKNTLRLLAVKILLWSIQHRALSIVACTFLILIFLLIFAPSTPIFETVSYFLLVEYFLGTIYYVLQAIKKIENVRGEPDLAQITILECELIKKDLNILLPMIGLISSIGMATIVFNPYQASLPRSSVIVIGMVIEAMMTTTFALLYWWFFFFLMERYTTEKAAFWASLITALPFLVGSYATVSIALYFGLGIIEDFVVAFLPFLVVYYWISRSIPDYTLSAPRSFEAETFRLARETERIEKALEIEIIEARKTRLQAKLSKLNINKRKLEIAIEWSRIGYVELQEIKKNFLDFHQQIRAAEQIYLSKVKGLSRKKIGLLINNELFVAERISKLSFNLTRPDNSVSNRAIKAVVRVMSLRDVAIRTCGISRITGFKNVEIFKNLHRSRSHIAIQEASTRDMPEPCRAFDRKTLGEYFPAKTRFEVCQVKYRKLLYHMNKYPSSFAWEKFEQAQSDLLLSIDELRNRIQERIDGYFLLEKDYPDCYMVRAFKLFFGWFGVSALRDFLKGLSIYEQEISNRKQEIEKLESTITITLE